MIMKKLNDTYSYKGWLSSDSVIKRALAVTFYAVFGHILIAIMLFGILLIFALIEYLIKLI